MWTICDLACMRNWSPRILERNLEEVDSDLVEKRDLGADEAPDRISLHIADLVRSALLDVPNRSAYRKAPHWSIYWWTSSPKFFRLSRQPCRTRSHSPCDPDSRPRWEATAKHRTSYSASRHNAPY